MHFHQSGFRFEQPASPSSCKINSRTRLQMHGLVWLGFLSPPAVSLAENRLLGLPACNPVFRDYSLRQSFACPTDAYATPFLSPAYRGHHLNNMFSTYLTPLLPVGWSNARGRRDPSRTEQPGASSPSKASLADGDPLTTVATARDYDRTCSHQEIPNNGRTEDEGEDEDDGGKKLEVELRNVTLLFGNKRVLDDVSLEIEEGEAVALIGPSGTGKSTVLRLICGLLLPSSGQVFIRGEKRVRSIREDVRPISSAKIAVVFQNPALFDSLSVAENVAFELLENSTLPEARIAELAMIALERVGLGREVMHLLPRQLSGGMQKRVSFARSVTFDPDDTDGICRSPNILLLDEPTAGLDPVVSTRMEDLVRELQRVCRTCVVVTHSFSTVRRTVDRVVFLHEGKVRWDGPVSDIDRTDNPYVRQFFSASLNGPMEFQDGIRQSRIGDAGPRQSDSDGLEEDLSRK